MSWLPYFCPKSFDFFCIRLLAYFHVISSLLLVELSFVVLEYPVFSVLFYPLSITLLSSFFHQYFLVYFPKLYFSFSCVTFSFLSLHVPTSFLCFIILAYFRRFFLSACPVEFPIQVLIISSCYLRGSQFSHKLISPLHRFVHLIRLYYSLILTLFHSMFHHDGKVVFSPFIILFEFSRFTFCSCVSVCSGYSGWALFDCVAFLFSEVGGSFRLGCFRFLILDVSDMVLLSCSLFIFRCISSISSSEKQLFFIIILTWSANLWLVVWKLAYSCQISIILVLYYFCVGSLIKYLCIASLFSSVVHVLCLRLWFVCFLKSSFVYLKKEQLTFAGWQ